MHDFITSAGGVATSVLAIISLITLVAFKPIKKVAVKRRQKTETEERFRSSMMQFASDTNARMASIESAIDGNEKDRIRREMFTFAGECRRGERHTLDEFRHVFTLKDKYDALLQKSGEKNGVFDAEFKYIVGVFEERQQKNDFLQ